MSSVPLTSLDFRRALGHFATGVTVITVESSPHRVRGMTANSFTSVSLVPPLVSVCVDERAHLLPLLKQSRRFGVNVLKADQQHLSEFFARPEPPAPKPVAHNEDDLKVAFRWNEVGIPLLDHVLCQIACRLYAAHPAGDHTIIVAEVLSASLYAGEPLIFYRGDYSSLRDPIA